MAFTKIAAAGIGSTGTVTLENLFVTGTLNVPIITGAASTANVSANSLVVSGVSTLGSVVATTGTFSGNVSIAGTLTYEDVTNIDSIGIVTARSGVRINSGGLVVTSGVSTLASLQVGTAVTISGGIVTATSFYGDGTNLTNTGSTLSAASGSQRVVLTSQTSGTMTSSATSAALTFNAATGALSATSFVGDGTNLTNTGSTLSAASGSQRVVLTGQTSGTMTSSATSASLTFDASTGQLSATSFSGSGASLTSIPNSATTATSSNTNSTIVARDASGNFSAGTITGTQIVGGTGTAYSNAGLVVNGTSGNDDSQLVIKKPSQSSFGILTWDNAIYLSSNIYYSNGTWVHDAPSGNNNNQLFTLIPGTGVSWYASNNGTGSWNVANAITLWNDSGVWVRPVSGSTFTNYSETVYAFGNTGATPTFALSNGNFVTATLNANITSMTFSMTGVPSGAFSFTLFLRNDATPGRTITWPVSVRWPNGSIPVRTTTANQADVYTFFTTDGGSTWYGNLSLYNYA